MVRVRATHEDTRPPEASHDAGPPAAAVWGVKGVTVEAIVPDRPADRRMRGRLYAMRAMERLGLLGEENLILTLARRPELRWLADEEGARWDVLRQLGRIGEKEIFDEAVAWTLQNRPSLEQIGSHVWRIRAGGASEPRRRGRRPSLAGARDARAPQETARKRRQEKGR